jgi:hypothetical protein
VTREARTAPGARRLVAGTRRVVLGLRRLVVGTRRVVLGLRRLVVGAELAICPRPCPPSGGLPGNDGELGGFPFVFRAKLRKAPAFGAQVRQARAL